MSKSVFKRVFLITLSIALVVFFVFYHFKNNPYTEQKILREIAPVIFKVKPSEENFLFLEKTNQTISEFLTNCKLHFGSIKPSQGGSISGLFFCEYDYEFNTNPKPLKLSIVVSNNKYAKEYYLTNNIFNIQNYIIEDDNIYLISFETVETKTNIIFSNSLYAYNVKTKILQILF